MVCATRSLRWSGPWRAPIAIVLVALLGAGCSGAELLNDEPADRPAGELIPAEPPSGPGDPTRDDLDCDEEALGADEVTTFEVAHYVVAGRLGDVCFGERNELVVEAWEQLADITPPGQLGDLGLFAGFASGEDGDEVSLAFVNTIDDDGTLFQMSVNIVEAQDDPDELLLTMAHEFSHVFTGLDTQIDRSLEAFESCATYFNGEGCYRPDSLMFDWIEAFWSDGLIDEVDPESDATADAGQERCDLEPGFFGAYAASNPEEDFAESFAAYVFDVEPAGDAQQAKLDWIDEQPGLAEFRERAAAAGYTPLDYSFDPCG